MSLAVGIAFVALALIIFAPGSDSPNPNLYYKQGNVAGYEQCVVDISGMQFEGRGTTTKVPYDVQLLWNTDRFMEESVGEFSVVLSDSQTDERLSDVTYDFVYKGVRDLGVLEDRRVEDFEEGPDSFELPLKYPCDLHLIILVDKVGQKSYLPDDPKEIESRGNSSAVGVEFRMVQSPNGLFGMEIFELGSDVDSAHTDIPSLTFDYELKLPADD